MSVDFEEDTYSRIFSALKHPARRKILAILNESPASYTELLNRLGVESGFLSYHLENLSGLVSKDQEDRYFLSEFGKAGLALTERIEEPVKQRANDQGSSGRWIFSKKRLSPSIVTVMTIAIIVLISLNVFQYFELRRMGSTLDEYTRYPDESKFIPAWLMIGRFSVTSHPETIIDVKNLEFQKYPKLKTAFEVEEVSNAIGYPHPYEWVNCTNREGREIIELFGGSSVPLGKYNPFNIRYGNQNYSILIVFDWRPPIID
jgi:DNA-binding transcriptional ArsR family regulator